MSRTPELEPTSAKTPQPETAKADLAARLRDTQHRNRQAFTAAVQDAPLLHQAIRLLVVDDDREFLANLHDVAGELQRRTGAELHIETLAPEDKRQVRKAILRKFVDGEGFDYVLLDYDYQGKSLNGLDLLATLRRNSGKKHRPLAELPPAYVRLYYLPVAIVTRGGSRIENNLYFNEQALGAGADKVYAEKGFGVEERAMCDGGVETGLSSAALLETLLKTGFKEMQFRAWARLWQDLRDQLEISITDQLAQNLWLGEADIELALQNVWEALAQPIKAAGYAEHLSMRILSRDGMGESTSWVLRKVGSTDPYDCCLGSIPWDVVPILRQRLVVGVAQVDVQETLSESMLIDPRLKGYPDIVHFRHYLGRRAMVARLETREGPVGTFFITRKAEQPPFFMEDRQHLKSIVVRLGLFYRELKMRWRNHYRQMALVELGEKLLEEQSEDGIVSQAVKVLHRHLHEMRDLFTPDPANNPAHNGRVTIRLIEPGTGRLVRPYPGQPEHPWALGFDTTNREPPGLITVQEPDHRYRTILNEGGPRFYPNVGPNEVDARREGVTHAKMLVPIMAGPVVVGAVNVEHKDAGFYGRQDKSSPDYALLQAIALEVGRALHALRARRMQRKLLALHTVIGQADEEEVIDSLMHILYDYTGCAAGLWAEPSNENWRIAGVWECPQGYQKGDTAPESFVSNRKTKAPSARVAAWHYHIMEHFDESLIGRMAHGQLPVSPDEPVDYSESGFLDDTVMGIKTRSQATLALYDPESSELLGVFSLAFNQQPGLDEKRQKPLLEEAARFAAGYLSIRRKNREYLLNSAIMKQQAMLGDAYQQLRHSIRLQLGALNGAADQLIRKFRLNRIDQTMAVGIAQQIQQILRRMAVSIEQSRVLVNPPSLKDIEVGAIWAKVCEHLAPPAAASGATLEPLVEPVAVHIDAEVLEMVFTYLIDNAIEAMEKAGSPERRVRCRILHSTESGMVRLSVIDTGPGVPRDVAARMFKEIGVSTKPGGTGFQNYFSAFKLEQCNARIEYDLDNPRGAAFILTLPVAKHPREIQP